MGCTQSQPEDPSPPRVRKPSSSITNQQDIPPPNIAGVGQPALDNNGLYAPVHPDTVRAQMRTLINNSLHSLLELQAFMTDHPPSTFVPQFRDEIGHELCMAFDVTSDLQVRCKETCAAHEGNVADSGRSCSVCSEKTEARRAAQWEEKRRTKLG